MFKKVVEDVTELSFRERLLLLLIFVLPFERIPTFELGGMTIKLSLLVGGLLVILESRRILDLLKDLLKKRSFLLIPLFFLGYSLLSLTWIQNQSSWLRHNLTLGFCIAIFYAVLSVLNRSRAKSGMANLVKLIVGSLFASTLLILGFGFFQWLGNLLNLSSSLTQIRPEYAADKLGLPRMHSTFLEPLYFGLFLLLPLGLSLADRKNRFFGNLYWRFGFVALIYAGILLSLARGAIAASAVMGLVAIFYNFKELKKQLKFSYVLRIILAGALSLVILVGVVSILGKKGSDEDHNYAKGIGTITGHLETIRPWGNKKDAEEENSLNSRDVARSEALSLIKSDNSILFFGVGAGQYGEHFEPKRGVGETSNMVILDVWLEFGIFVAIALLCFVLFLVYSGFKLKDVQNRDFGFGLSLFVVGFLIQGISFGEIAVAHLWVGLALVASLSLEN